ncbi:MAG: hypothetical protein KAX38_02650, partial [Candidatus Krumholzibacteria bacterium]|nr:hypothetical protein [Candidatus Krumholzibacteria bacterium]
MNKKIFLIVIVGMFCLANVTRWAFRSGLAYPRFVAEGAAHFRYTEIVASGGVVPSLDVKAQWPEGLRVYRETAVGMEYLYGLIYRLIPGDGPKLPAFVRFFTAFFFSLAIFPLAFLSAGLWRSRAAGVLTAALFAVALPLVSRSNGFEMIRENVTLPLLIYHIYFFYSAESGRGWGAPILSGAFLALALSTWQGTQFYLVPFLLFLIVRRFMYPVTVGERRAARVMILFIAAAGACVPFLREGRFVLSVPAALAAAWLVADLLSPLGEHDG